MQATFKQKDIDQLLAEADELIRQIDADAVKEMAEEHRVQIEMHTRSLKKLRSDIQGKIAQEGTAESGSYYEGMHKAILDIISAVKNMGSYLS